MNLKQGSQPYCVIVSKSVNSSGAGMERAGVRAHPGFCQGAVTKERKVELLREFTWGHVGRAKEQRLDTEEKEAGRRPGVAHGGSVPSNSQ